MADCLTFDVDVARHRKSAGSSVGGMGYFSDDECQEPDSFTDSPLRRNEVVETRRDAEVSEYATDGPVIVGPGLPPEDGSCGQFAVQFHVTTTTVVGLKRIADARGAGARIVSTGRRCFRCTAGR